SSAFKVWLLVPGLKIAARVIVVAAILAAIFACFYWADQVVGIRLKIIGWLAVSTVATIVIGKLLSPGLAKVLNTVSGIRTQVWRMVLFVVLAVLGFVVAAIHIGIFDRWYLYRGRLSRLMAHGAPPRKEQ